ncbi:HPP family protein [Vibrio quintilis]|uniref:HPP family protein n=1 Tax=Vibrio quintilis TaxID=1117707 RepID=A0A1M7YVZ2_9VIBR|nr:HPP family protein [Vibrio quintilis]SHO56771.1 HPP family protein [Vibrio quintilis]
MRFFMFALFAGFGAAVAIGILSLSEAAMGESAFLMAPFGATAALVFGVSASPFSRPKNVILGHMMTAVIGLLFVEFVGVTSFCLALATGVAVSAMLLTRIIHPPAGANPLLIMLTGQSWDFLITPVLSGTVVIVVLGRGMRYLYMKMYTSSF